VIRAVPGAEPATGLELELGPRLIRGDDPLLEEHLAELRDHWRALAARTAAAAPAESARFATRAAFVEAILAERGRPGA
jgi:hypothetical protein